MLRSILLLALILFNFELLAGRPVKVLFIGNGILSFSYIPWEFKDLSESTGQEVSIDTYMQDSYTLSLHNGLMGDTRAIAKIKSQKWDFVVLQEQSFFPVIPELTRNFTVPAIEDLSKVIKTNNYCTQIVLFMTWARPFGDQYCVHIDSLDNPCSIPFMDFFHMQDSLETSYLRIAESVGAELAPVGVAWDNSFNQDPRLNLFWRDTNL
jgi:hypothetical protein